MVISILGTHKSVANLLMFLVEIADDYLGFFITQVGGTVDNLEEMCATHVSRALRLKKPLILTHQIDTCTEGWSVFSFYLSLESTILSFYEDSSMHIYLSLGVAWASLIEFCKDV